MNSLTKGTRRSTWPLVSSANDLQRKKLNKFTEIGYEVVADNGFSALLSYYPYGGQYVKLVQVEDGRAKNTLKLTPKQLRALSERIDKKQRK